MSMEQRLQALQEQVAMLVALSSAPPAPPAKKKKTKKRKPAEVPQSFFRAKGGGRGSKIEGGLLMSTNRPLHHFL
jgi:hypothetical protein